jgi:ElaB/YqjD/DUF883 family membrane-anchored ribosome-binding protein
MTRVPDVPRRRAARAARALAALLVLLLAVSALAACGGDDEPSAEEQLCSNLDSLSESVTALQDIDLSSASVDELQTDLQNVKDAAGEVVQSAQEVAQADVSELQSSLDELESAIKGIPSDGVEPVQSALGNLSDTRQSISDDAGCDGS